MKRHNSVSGTAGNPIPLFLDIDSLRILTGYAHWIPVTRGLYKDYFERNFPGWEWNQVIPELHKAKVLTRTPENSNYRELRMGLFISRGIKTISMSIEGGEVKIRIHNSKVLRKAGLFVSPLSYSLPMTTKRRKSIRTLICPDCGEIGTLRKILYGMPDPETFDFEKYAVGGCCVSPDGIDPDVACKACGWSGFRDELLLS